MSKQVDIPRPAGKVLIIAPAAAEHLLTMCSVQHVSVTVTLFLVTFVLVTSATPVLPESKVVKKAELITMEDSDPSNKVNLSTIIDVPVRPCPPGQKRDYRGRCRRQY